MADPKETKPAKANRQPEAATEGKKKGFAIMSNEALIDIIENENARPDTIIRALRELRNRPGGTISGLDMLSDEPLAKIIEDKNGFDEELRLAAADVLALR
jgi:hypothetical protein